MESTRRAWNAGNGRQGVSHESERISEILNFVWSGDANKAEMSHLDDEESWN